MERTTGNSCPQEVQTSFPSVISPLFPVASASSSRRAAPHPMHLNHSTELKCISSCCSLRRIHSLEPISKIFPSRLQMDSILAAHYLLRIRNQFIRCFHRFPIHGS